MVILKVVLMVLAAVVALVILTVVWIVILGIGMPKGSAVDIALLFGGKLSPLYWFTVVAIVVLWVWLARRWAFS